MLVHHALRGAGRTRGVHDDHPVVRGDVVLGRVEHRVRHPDGERLQRAEPLLQPDVPQERHRRRRHASPRPRPTRRAARPRSRCRGTRRTPSSRSTSARASRSRSSIGVEKVLMGTAIAPTRAVASHATTKSRPVGYSRPIRLPRPGARRQQPARQHPAAAFGVGIGEAVVVADDVVGVGTLGDARAQDAADRGGGAHARRGETAGSAARSPQAARISASHSTVPSQLESRPRVDPAALDGALGVHDERREQRRRPPEPERELGRLAREAEIAIELLEHAVEEHREEAAVHDPGRSLVADRELDRAPGQCSPSASTANS